MSSDLKNQEYLKIKLDQKVGYKVVELKAYKEVDRFRIVSCTECT